MKEVTAMLESWHTHHVKVQASVQVNMDIDWNEFHNNDEYRMYVIASAHEELDQIINKIMK